MTPAAPALIGLAHGSRDVRAAAAIESLLRAVEALRPGLTARPAFLELAPPTLTEAAAALSGRPGVVVPLLFTSAYHSTIDAPEQVSAARAAGAELHLAAPLGLGPEILAALHRRAEEAGIEGADEVLLLAVGSSRPGANEAVEELARRWAAHRGGAVTVGFATCAPRAVDVMTELVSAGRAPAVVPLFLAPGLLLDQMLDHPVASDRRSAAVLGDLLAPLVLRRYDEAVSR